RTGSRGQAAQSRDIASAVAQEIGTAHGVVGVGLDLHACSWQFAQTARLRIGVGRSADDAKRTDGQQDALARAYGALRYLLDWAVDEIAHDSEDKPTPTTW